MSRIFAQSPGRAFPLLEKKYRPIAGNQPTTGASWYDALQFKATKRLSHGLDFTSTFSWQKELSTQAVNNVFDRSTSKNISAASRPLLLTMSGNYHVPRLETNSVVSALLGDWVVGALLRFASGAPLRVPTAQAQLSQLNFQNTNAECVAGEPLFTQDLNCHCFNPNKDFVLNPKAWADPPDGQFGHTANYLNEFRGQRRPREAMSLAREFRINGIREGATLQFRLEFENVFNRAYLVDTTLGNARATQTKDSNGNAVSGHGRINTGASATTGFLPRQGEFVARLRF